MNAEELWKQSGLTGSYEAWAFGDAPDKLAGLVLDGVKRATSSAFAVYEKTGEPVPKPGEYSVILDSKEQAVCIIRTTAVTIVPYREVTAEFAAKEGEGDRSLAYWRSVHEPFFTGELAEAGMTFDESTPVVCEEFEVVTTAH